MRFGKQIKTVQEIAFPTVGGPLANLV